MSTLKSSAEDLTLNADGSGNDVIIQSDGSTKAIVNAEGNVGIGVTPETWDSSYNALQIGGNGAVAATSSQAAGGKTLLGQNVYVDSGSGVYEYISTDEASLIYQQNGEHKFRVAASGSADAAITWTDALIIKNDGRGLSQFTARAWVNYDQKDTAAVRDSHNVSSVTDSGTGQHQVNLTNAMANANYAVSLTVNGSGATADGFAMNEQNNNTTSMVRNITYASSSMTDLDCTHTIVFGD